MKYENAKSLKARILNMQNFLEKNTKKLNSHIWHKFHFGSWVTSKYLLIPKTAHFVYSRSKNLFFFQVTKNIWWNKKNLFRSILFLDRYFIFEGIRLENDWFAIISYKTAKKAQTWNNRKCAKGLLLLFFLDMKRFLVITHDNRQTRTHYKGFSYWET